jgi:transposase, IS5 family
MRRKRIGQLGFGDAAAVRAMRGRDTLGQINGLVDWAPIERLLDGIHAASRGEPAYPPLMMFKVLLLQRWHGLSDPQMEAALADRLSFLRFAGLSLEDETPDHSTIWRFRERLTKGGLIEAVFAAVLSQLSARGMVLKQGTLIDASLVTSAARRPRMDAGFAPPRDQSRSRSRLAPPRAPRHTGVRYARNWRANTKSTGATGLIASRSSLS